MYIYLHIPFCASKCIYCDFYVVLNKHGGIDQYQQALFQELHHALQAQPTPATRLNTLYAGGGTPSLLPTSFYQSLFETLRSYLQVGTDAELTMEFNPNHVADALAAYKDAGINRVSVGIQSFDDTELRRISRSHTAQEAADFVKALQQAGFQNISIDLMYGIPQQTPQSWAETLKKAIDLGVQHISMYGLKVEEGTPLAKLVPFQAYTLPGEDETVEMYFSALELLASAGFQRYEFSNLAQPGFESRHNLNYWNNGPYLGLGPGAHGYWQNMRTENPGDLAAYLLDPCGIQTLTQCPTAEALENALIFGLRKAEGVHLPTLAAQYGVDIQVRYGKVLKKHQDLGFLHLENGVLTLPLHAIPVSNSILADFLITE